MFFSWANSLLAAARRRVALAVPPVVRLVAARPTPLRHVPVRAARTGRAPGNAGGALDPSLLVGVPGATPRCRLYDASAPGTSPIHCGIISRRVPDRVAHAGRDIAHQLVRENTVTAPK